MSSRYLDALAANRAHISTLYFVIVFLMLSCLALWAGWREAPRNIRISIPPDLRAGAVVRPGEYQAANVYAFATIYLQALYRWEENGADDFPARIEEFQAYVTPKYLEELQELMNKKMKRGELNKRRRYTIPVTGYQEYQPEHVETLDDGSWRVDVALKIVEKVSGIEAKNVSVLYPLHIVRYNIDPLRNVWGLAINGIVEGQVESRIDEKS